MNYIGFRILPLITSVAVIAALLLLGQSTKLSISPAALPQGEIALAYSVQLQASGGTAPYTWKITTGALPTGLTLSMGGLIAGTPNGAGTSFAVMVKDSTHLQGQMSYTMTIAPKLVIVTDTCPPGEVGVPYACQIVGAGGVPPYKCIADKPLPPGLTLDSAKCLVSGTPTKSGTYTF